MIYRRILNFILSHFRTFRVSIQHSTGILKERIYPLARSLQIGGLIDDSSAQQAPGEMNVHDFADSSLQIRVFRKTLSISFPTRQQVAIDGEVAFDGLTACASNLQRMTLNRPWPCENLEFAFANGSVIHIHPQAASLEDFLAWIKSNSTPALVMVAHVMVLVLMGISFAMPSRSKTFLPDVSQVQVSLRYSDTGGLVGAPTTGTVVTQEMAALQRSLKKFRISNTQSKPTEKFSGFASALAASSGGNGLSGRIGFSAAGVEKDSPPLNLSPQQLNAVFETVNPQLKECYDDVLVRDASLQGRPQVIVQVAQEGSVQNVGIQYLQGRSAALAMLQDCFQRTFRTVKFPKANQAFAVTQTLVLVR